MLALDLVFLEQPAIEVGHGAEQRPVGRGALGLRQGEAAEEQGAEHLGEKTVPPAILTAAGQLAIEVVQVSPEKALLLDEVDEHQPVQRDRGVPASRAVVRQAAQEGHERVVLGLERIVEPLGDFVGVEGAPQPVGHIGGADAAGVFLFQGELQRIELLSQSLRVIAGPPCVFAQAVRSSGFALHPLPDLRARGVVGEDDEMLALLARERRLDRASPRAVWQGRGAVEIERHAPLLRDGPQALGRAADVEDNVRRVPEAVPAKLLHEELGELAALKPVAQHLAGKAGHPDPTPAPGRASRG